MLSAILVLFLPQSLPPVLLPPPLPGKTAYLDLPDFGGSPLGPITRTFAGSLTTDLIPDLVVIRGTELVLLPGPDLFEAALRLPETIHDATVVRGASLNEIVTVGPLGLRRWTIDESVNPPSFLATSLNASVEWQGARRVRSTDFNLDTEPDYVGIAADGRTVRVLLSGPGGLTPGASFVPARAPIDIVTYDRDGDGVQEIAAAHRLGLEIWSFGGNVLATFANPHGSDAIVAVRSRLDAPAELAWLRRSAADGTRCLQLVGPGGLVLPVLSLGANPVAGAAAADIDLDGDEDLALGQVTSQSVLVLENLFDANAPASMPYSTVAGVGAFTVATGDGTAADPGNVATPVWHDFDTDGDPDLAMGIEHAQRALFFRNGAVANPLPELINVRIGETLPPGTLDARLYFDLEYVLPAGTTNVQMEIALWERPDVEDPTTSTAIAHLLLQVGGGSSIVPASFVLPETASGITSMYAVTVRPVVPGVGSALRPAGPANTFQFVSTESDPEAPPYFLALPGAGESVIVTASSGSGEEGDAPPEGGRDIGVIVPVPDLPDIPKGELPKPPTT